MMGKCHRLVLTPCTAMQFSLHHDSNNTFSCVGFRSDTDLRMRGDRACPCTELSFPQVEERRTSVCNRSRDSCNLPRAVYFSRIILAFTGSMSFRPTCSSSRVSILRFPSPPLSSLSPPLPEHMMKQHPPSCRWGGITRLSFVGMRSPIHIPDVSVSNASTVQCGLR